MKRIGIGLYGENGHQISDEMIWQAGGKLIGVCKIKNSFFEHSVKQYENLAELLDDPNIELVSVCAPLRSEQAEVIKQILKRGKHVYAEKPCVMKENDLDEILKIAEERHVIFCEMAGTILERPYNKARDLISQGNLGEIVQIFVQKSYPYAEFRPQDEAVDGGLMLQNAIYGIRFVEHIAGIKVVKITDALETSLGNPQKGNLKMACAMQMELENGGIASVIANYLNQPGTKIWGNEELRVFGTKGYLKTNIFDKNVDVFIGEKHLCFESIPEKNLLECLIESIQNKRPFPYTAEFLVHPTRMVLRAKNKLRNEKLK